MTPKKKKGKKKSLIGVYDVEMMTSKELKDYIGILIGEKENIKLLLVQLERDKHEAMDLLQNTDTEIFHKIECSIQKDFDMQKQLNASLLNLMENERKNLLSEVEFSIKDAKCNFEAFERIQLAKILLKEEKQNQRKLVDDVVREIERTNVDGKFVLFDERESEEVQIVEKENNLEEIQTIFENCTRTYQDAVHNFQKEKVDKIVDIFEWNVEENNLQDSFSKNAEEMVFYFKEMFGKNLEAITSLKTEIAKHENELDKLKIQARDAKWENKQLKLNKLSSSDPGIQKENVADQVEVNITNDNEELDEVSYDNDVLKEKLRNISKERDALRNRFISAKRKIIRKAEFKSFLLEQMLIALKCNNMSPDTQIE